MPFRDEYRFDELKNSAEDLVILELEKQLSEKELPLILTQEAVLDIAACALNMIKPQYQVNLLGRVYASEFEALYQKEISEAVASAIEKISENPPL